jgi:hypothetical protein
MFDFRLFFGSSLYVGSQTVGATLSKKVFELG